MIQIYVAAFVAIDQKIRHGERMAKIRSMTSVLVAESNMAIRIRRRRVLATTERNGSVEARSGKNTMPSQRDGISMSNFAMFHLSFNSRLLQRVPASAKDGLRLLVSRGTVSTESLAMTQSEREPSPTRSLMR